MTREEIIEEITKLKLDKNEFWISGTSALVLRNIIDQANDIDLVITTKLYEELNKRIGLTYLGTNHEYKWYKVNDNIECCVEEIKKEKVEITEPFNLIDLKYYYDNFLKDSTREKDIKKKELIKNVLDSYETII